MKWYKRIVDGITADIPTLLQGIGFNGSETLKKKLDNFAKISPFTSTEVLRFHAIYMVICYGSLLSTLIILFNTTITTYIANIFFGIFLVLFILMVISWFIYVDCPLTYLQKRIEERECQMETQ